MQWIASTQVCRVVVTPLGPKIQWNILEIKEPHQATAPSPGYFKMSAHLHVPAAIRK